MSTDFETWQRKKLGPELGAIAAKLDATLRSVQPKYTSKPAWSGYAYKLGDNYSCIITDYKDHLKLMIWRGVDLDDPESLLEGSGGNTRHIRYASLGDVQKAKLRALLKQQFALYAAGETAERKPARATKASAKPATKRVPAALRKQLVERGLLDAYKVRPPYQRTGYVQWIDEAKRDVTKEKRRAQMFAELEAGDVYMKMPWRSR